MPERKSPEKPAPESAEPGVNSSVNRLPGKESAREIDQFLTDAVYEELIRLARSVKRSDPHATASSATLVHKAWLKLAESSFTPLSRLHFMNAAARAMQQILYDAARRRMTRGGPYRTLSATIENSLRLSHPNEFIAFSEGLERLDVLSPRQAQIVKLRAFAGLEHAEIANLLGIAKITVERDWRAAKALLLADVARSR